MIINRFGVISQPQGSGSNNRHRRSAPLSFALLKPTLLSVFTVGVVALTSFATPQIEAIEIPLEETAPRAGALRASRDQGDFLFSIDVETVTGDLRCLGVENTGIDHTWWVTGAADFYGAFLYRITYDGLVLTGYYPQGHTGWGWRDLAFDGSYLYASESYSIEQIDPATGLTTGLIIASPTSPARALAYDPASDSFWAANSRSSIYNIFRNGSYITYANPEKLSIFGMAMDEENDILWAWSQEGAGTLASAFDPRIGAFTGASWDGGAAPDNGVAGGACIYTDPAHGLVFAGLHQSVPDNVAVYEIKLDTDPQLDIRCNGADQGAVVAQSQKVHLEIDIEARQGSGTDVDIFCAIRRASGDTYCYDGDQWISGLGSAYATGPLVDLSDSILNHTVPRGKYVAYLVLDTIPNGALDMNAIEVYDSVDFEVIEASGFAEDFEDGFADNWIADGPQWTVGNGVYALDASSYAHWISYYDAVYHDSIFSADMRMVDTGAYNDYYRYGLFFHSDGTLDNCYSVTVSNTGTCRFEKILEGTAITLHDGPLSNMHLGAGQWNNMGVHARSGVIDIYCNGSMEFSIIEDAFQSGMVGIRGEGSGLFDQDYEFDNVGLTL